MVAVPILFNCKAASKQTSIVSLIVKLTVSVGAKGFSLTVITKMVVSLYPNSAISKCITQIVSFPIKLGGACTVTQLSLLFTAISSAIPLIQTFTTPTVFNNSKTESIQTERVSFSSITK